MSNDNLKIGVELIESGKGLKNIEKGLDNVEKKSEESSKKMANSFSDAIKKIGAMIALNKIGSDLLQAEKTALGLDIIKAKNKQLANAMEHTSEVSFGLANKFEMVDAVNKAMAFGIDLSHGRYEKLLKMATKVAAVMGTDVKSAFNDIIVASGRQSRMIADNLGVIVSATTANQKYASQLGITAKQLTDNQKKTAFLNEMIVQMGDSTKKVTDQMMENHQNMTKSLAIYKKAYQDSLGWGTKFLNDTASTWEKIGEKWADIVAGNYSHIAQVRRAYEEETRQFYSRQLRDFNSAIKSLQDKDDEIMFDPFGAQKNTTTSNLDNFLKKTQKKREAYRRKEDAARKRAIAKAHKDELKAQKEFNNDLSTMADLFYKQEQKAKEDEEMWYNLDKERELDAERKLNEDKLKLKAEYDKEQAKLREKERAQQEKYFNGVEQFGRGMWNAILSDQENAIPLFLANQAMMYGQDLLWDGVKTVWKGASMNSVLPGSGTQAMITGGLEIAAGGALMAGGAIAQNSFSTSNSGGATERTSQNQKTEITMNVNTSLYNTRKEAKKEFKELIG